MKKPTGILTKDEKMIYVGDQVRGMIERYSYSSWSNKREAVQGIVKEEVAYTVNGRLLSDLIFLEKESNEHLPQDPNSV